MATFDNFIASITSLDMLTENTIQKIWWTNKESILLPNVNITLSEMKNWEERNAAYVEGSHVYLEYDGPQRSIILRTPGSYIQSMTVDVFWEWFNVISNDTLSMTCRGLKKRDVNLRDTGSVKIPDVTLMQLPSSKPIITALVGHDRTLDELFRDAKQLLQNVHMRGVFILKIYEGEHPTLIKPPWDMLMGMEQSQIEEVLVYYHTHNIPLVGKLSVDLYLWSSESSIPPHHPLWSFQCGHDTLEQPGTLNSIENPLLDTNTHLKILDESYALPMERLQDELQMAIESEEYDRACNCINENHFFVEKQEQ